MSRTLRKLIVVLLTMAGMVSSSQAHATTVGTMLTTVVTAFTPFTDLLSAAAYVMGFFLAILGIYKFKDHVDNPAQIPLSDGIKRFIAGGMFLSLPYMSAVVQGSLVGAGGVNLSSTGNTSASLSGGLDTMIVNFVANISGPAQTLFSLFCWIAGFMFLMTGISRLTKRMEDGPRGPAGIGTLMTFIVAGIMFSIGDSMAAMVGSLFTTGTTVKTIATISSSVISNVTDAQRIQLVIEAVMNFVMLVGIIAFIRGWFVLKAFADGQQSATVAQGLTFLIGGALAINLGEFINILQTTMGLTCGGGVCINFT